MEHSIDVSKYGVGMHISGSWRTGPVLDGVIVTVVTTPAGVVSYEQDVFFYSQYNPQDTVEYTDLEGGSVHIDMF
jgi:hypothetical protein